MLNTLDVCGNKEGRIESYDPYTQSDELIRQFPNLMPKWHFHQCAMNNPVFDTTADIDYLFIEGGCDIISTNVINNVLSPLLARLRLYNKKIYVVYHVIFHSSYGTTHELNPEGREIIKFLETNKIQYFSPQNYDHFKTIAKLRSESGLDRELIHGYLTNPAIFFQLG
jgi:hypothetical protein